MKEMKVIVVIAILFMSCNTNKPFIQAGKVAQRMWQADTCGIHGNRASLAFLFNEKDFYSKNFKTQKKVVDFFGAPDLVTNSERQQTYFYLLSAMRGCKGAEEKDLIGGVLKFSFENSTKRVLYSGISFLGD